MAFVEYVTQQNDRWDTIAWTHYGDEYAYEQIIVANPTVPIVPALPAGLRLAIPVVAREAALAAALLPPWKR